ncbi:DUF6800 family protein [Gloeobacter kilaueensis]|uniref:Uncharacterized protein n=1 Tax=Gloeobacter kilaueensis (strain ATCC BAA-2537 / CCAP 1431/1 / ULC 316 / JS1) TaxID=1183438 RepID=U5QGN6_GLOK1|nr:DUF6800 family protein [Gloeobacter kilaueensis]AGY58137.1 hypothetical protein GKIL_1891 [Gloeobacter kilaueensis JS1]
MSFKKIERTKELGRRRHRKHKLAKLRARYLAAKSEAERKDLFNRAARVSPRLSIEEFANPSTAVVS